MYPLIKSGMWLKVQPCTYQEIRLGDIALLYQDNRLIAHRIVFRGKQGDKVYLSHKGDNACSIQIVPADSLMGKVVRIELGDKSLDLQRTYWRLVNRCMGFFWCVFGRILQWEGKKEVSPGNFINYFFSILFRFLLQLAIRLGYLTGQGIDQEPSWNQLAYASINSSSALPIRLPTRNKEWENFFKIIDSHNIHGLCYPLLRKYRKRVPKKILSRLAKTSHLVGYKNMKILIELTRLAKALEDKGIEVILLKGAALLASSVYSSPSQRKMSDIDILIKKEDLLEVETTLESLGFLPNGKENDNVAEWYRKYFREITYYKSAGNYCVDVHWSINEFFNIPYHELKNRSKSLDLNGVNMFTLSPEDTLLHLCLHAVFQDCLTIDFRHWADFVRIAQMDLNWSQVVINARRYRVEQVLYVAFYLEHKFLGVQIPLNVLDELRQACSCSLLRWLKKQANFADLHYPILETSWRLKLIRGWHDKIHYLTGVFFPSREELSLVNQFNSDSLPNYLKYFLFHKIHILRKTLSKLKFAYKRRGYA